MKVSDQNEYEDLLAEWSDLESGLGVLLSNPGQTQQFFHRVVQYDRWMQDVLERDTDVGLYMLFQLATNSPVGYSASHALVCAVLCHLLAQELGITGAQRDSLVRATLTMNVAMTRMQDVLATQHGKPTGKQQQMIQQHAQKGAHMLASLGVHDPLWLGVVAGHHDDRGDQDDFDTAPALIRLMRIVKLVDRYAAMISPRLSRAGRSATESVRMVMANAQEKTDPVGHAMVRIIGLYPPGTFVRMDNEELGIVVRRSMLPNPHPPYLVIVGSADGELLPAPRLHDPCAGSPHISAGLPANSVRAPLNHAQILKLGATLVQPDLPARPDDVDISTG